MALEIILRIFLVNCCIWVALGQPDDLPPLPPVSNGGGGGPPIPGAGPGPGNVLPPIPGGNGLPPIPGGKGLPPIPGNNGPGVPVPPPSTGTTAAPSVEEKDPERFSCPLRKKYCKDIRSARPDDALCFCDEFCAIMNDCCDDYVYDHQRYPNRKMNRLKYPNREILTKMECSGEKNIPRYPSGYLIMKKCPDGYLWSGKHRHADRLKNLCERDFTEDDRFRQWPVSSVQTGIFYRNVFCSMCWEYAGDSDDVNAMLKFFNTVKFWAVEMKCMIDEKEKEKLKEAKQTIDKVTKDDNNCGSRNETMKNMEACRYLSGFRNPFNCSSVSYRNLRTCSISYVSTCDSKWKWAKVKELCYGTTERVSLTTSSKTYYKNYYCAKCSNIDVKKVECLERGVGKGPVKLKGLAVLFDAEIGCKDNEIYDVFARRCRPLYCHSGQTLETDRCTWDDTNRTACALVRLDAKEYTLFNNGTMYLRKAAMYVNLSNYDVMNETVFVCNDILDHRKEDLISTPGLITNISLAVSICALFLLFMVYLILPNLRNVPGKILMALTFALFWAQVCFLVGIERTEIQGLCIAFAIVIHYFFLAAFAWTTMMAVDMALTFRPMNLHGTGASKKNRFLYVSLYAWCAPLVLVAPGIVMDQFDLVTDPFNPGYGLGKSACWFTNSMALIIFFLVPCGAHLLVNFICYAYTVYNIAAVSKLAKKAKPCDKCNLFLYFKLSVIMGGTWVLAYVWIVTRSDVIEFAFTILNGLQGLFLFLAFVCRKRTWRQLRRSELLSTSASRSTQETNMSLKYRNASYKFKHDRPTVTNSSISEPTERQSFI